MLLCSNISYCHNSTKFTCSRCKSVRYCSYSCQRQHYDVHKPYCLATADKIRGQHHSTVSRRIVLTDETYDDALKAQQNGKVYQISGRDGISSYVVLRRDGLLYESPSGVLVEKMSAVKRNMFDITPLTTWGKLNLSCKLLLSENGYSILHNEAKRKMYLYNSKTDRKVETIANITSVDTAFVALKIMLDSYTSVRN